MNWPASIGVGLLCGLVGFIVAFAIALLAVEWYRIPSREGAAGFFTVGVALLVFVCGVIFGLIYARLSPEPSILQAWGRASAIIAVAGSVALTLTWLFADLPPKWDGHRLELIIELRAPAGFAMPPLEYPSDAYVTIMQMPSGDSKGWSALQLDQTRTEHGQLIIPATLTLDTSAREKQLSARFGKGQEIRFPLAFGSKPGEQDQAWTDWIQSSSAADAGFQIRYRIQKEPPPAPVPTREELENEEQAQLDADYRALAQDAPLSAWLRFTRYGIAEERQREAAAAIRGRPDFEQEMTNAILGADRDLARETLRAFPHFPAPPVELALTVRQKGDDIAAAVRARSTLIPDDPARSDAGANISLDFSAWMEAVRTLQGHDGTTFIPQLEQIADQSRVPPIDQVIAIDVLRVASYYLHTWAGIQPHPEDPPPR
ncbi:ABC-2 transporter permease [Peristeroidobacter soli]|uniref:ECF transporter S component n=1 Tax=Peristeroidobacter soli TaxID=2497877 RepID=UPI00101D53BC|nr:ECF transporter S component [Peristeroidobacter soli]